MDIKMGNLGSIILVAAAFAITIVLQMTVSKMRWTFGGLILPMLVFGTGKNFGEIHGLSV